MGDHAEAESLAVAVQYDPDAYWPLFPNELKRLRRPPPVGRRPLDYKDRFKELRKYPDNVESLRAPNVLAHDLTLMRLGYDPDKKKRVALRVAIHRDGRR